MPILANRESSRFKLAVEAMGIFLRKVGDRIAGDQINLVVEVLAPANEKMGYVPAYIMGVFKNVTKERIGRISFRVGHSELIDRYAGHIGYSIDRQHRGNGYAEKGCRLLESLIKEHGFSTVFITCNPDNTPSKITIEKLGAELLGPENIPKNTEMYRKGDRIKLRYAWNVG